MIPSSDKLKYSPPAIIRWSSSFMSISFAASLSLLVSSLSATLGFVLPDGWLCAMIIWLALYSRQFFSIIRTSTTVDVMPPLLISSYFSTLRAWFRYITQNTSWFRSCSSGSTMLAASLLLCMVMRSSPSLICLRRPSSIAAHMVMPRASPMPFTFCSSSTFSLPSSFRLLLAMPSISLARSSADFSLVPLDISMASSSASVSAAAPFYSIFSRGRSSSVQFFMLFDSFIRNMKIRENRRIILLTCFLIT